ncbi:MAG: TonB-dependent receptor [Woeseiaceae bacterium]|nr:TonB-dependent receptor [Woeseiaceae bacterium]
MSYEKYRITALFAALCVPIGSAIADEEESAHHEIDQIIVTATPLARTVEELALPTSVLRGDELAKKQSTSIGETVSQEVGVSSTYFGPVASRPVIRGQFGERVRVLSNGLDSLDASALSEDHQTTVEGLLADRIEIVRGPATLLYGSGAAGGLVNVVDKRIADAPLDAAYTGGIALGADTATGKRDIAARAQFGTDSVVFSADYFYRSTDNIDIPGFAESKALRELEEAEGEVGPEEEHGRGTVENSDSETDGGAIGVSFVNDSGFIGLSVSGFNSDYGVPGHQHEEPAVPPVPPIEEEEDVSIDLEQKRIDLKGEYEFDSEIIKGLRFRWADNDYTHTEFEGAETGTVYDTQGTDGRLELRHAKWGPFEGAVGLQFKRIDFNAIGDEAFVPSSDTKRTSLFIFEELELSDNFVLQGSARFEDQSITGATLAQRYDDSAFGASLGMVWRSSEKLRVSANLALTERHPNSTELYADGPHVAAQRYERGSATLGNGLLGKEMSTNFDVSVHGDTERAEWTLTGFINSVDDYILLRPTALELDGLPVYDFDAANVEFTGIEAEAIVELQDSDAGHVHMRVFADLVNAEEKIGGADLPRIPPMRIGMGFHGTWGAFDADLDVTFAADQDDVAENELPTEGYTLLSLSAGYMFADSDLYVFLSGTNLLDEDIRQHASPLKDLVPLPGRSIQAGLRYEF